jgi:hypothetical protein
MLASQEPDIFFRASARRVDGRASGRCLEIGTVRGLFDITTSGARLRLTLSRASKKNSEKPA